MCNCNNSYPCNNCANGQSCNCPPDYSITPAPVLCQCCPPGATYTPPSLGYPSGQCTDGNGNPVTPIPCGSCVDSTYTDCVTYQGNGINCFGINSGDSVTTMFQKMCNTLAGTVLSQISTSASLQATLCNIVSACPPATKGTPIVTVSTWCCAPATSGGAYIYNLPGASGQCPVSAFPNGCCIQVGTGNVLPPVPC
jgi:hypothetical protein